MLSGPVHFEQYVLDPDTRELRRDGVPRQVEPRVFDLLAYLVEHRERAVTKDELQDAVWPGVIVSETALTRAIMKARRAVDDDATGQRLIKTVHGHGYRFLGEIADPPPPAALEPPAPVPQPAETAATAPAPSPASRAAPLPPVADGAGRRGLPRFIVPLVAASLVLAVAALWWMGQAGDPSVRPAGLRVAVLPVVNDTGEDTLNWVDLGLMSLARNGLAELGVEVLSDANVVQLARNLGAGGTLADKAVGDAVRERLRSLYGVSHVLAMRLTQDAGALRMDFSLYGPEDTPSRSTMLGDETLRLAEAVTRSVGARLVGQRRLDVSNAGSGDAFVNEAYARGKGLALEGRCAQALPLLEVARTQDPGLFLPRFDQALCLRLLGRTDEATTLLLAMDEEYSASVPNAELADVLNLLGIVYTRTDSPDLARETLTRGLAVAEAVESAEVQAKLLVNLAILEKGKPDLPAAKAYLGRAQLAYQAAGYDPPPGYIYNTLSNIAMSEGRYADAEGHLTRALESWRNVGDRRLEAMALNNYGYLRHQQARLEDAEPYHLQALAIREEIGDRTGVGRSHNMLAHLYQERGDLASARASAQAALAIARDARDRLYQATALSLLGEVELTLGALPSAEEHLGEARALFEAIDDGLRILQTDVLVGRVRIAQGELTQARALADAVVQASDQDDGLAQVRVEGLELHGDIALIASDAQGALEHYSAALAHVESLSWGNKEAGLLAKLAQSQLSLGDASGAAPYIGRLLDYPPSPLGLKARARYAELEGDRQQARQLMEQARAAAGEAWGEADEAEFQRLLSAG
ncbi:MAG: tetratricopeptide repeat protein [Pseudomonadota bacterium]